MGTTPIYGIRYPDPTTKASQLPTSFQNLATDVEAALSAATIPPAFPAPVYVAPTAAARDIYWGVPATEPDRLTLQNRGAQTVRTDKGWTERYFATFNASTNPGGTTPAGWYPVGGQVPIGRMLRSGVAKSFTTAWASDYSLSTYWATSFRQNVDPYLDGWIVPVTGLYRVGLAIAASDAHVAAVGDGPAAPTGRGAPTILETSAVGVAFATNRSEGTTLRRLTAGAKLRLSIIGLTAATWQAGTVGEDSSHFEIQYLTPPGGV